MGAEWDRTAPPQSCHHRPLGVARIATMPSTLQLLIDRALQAGSWALAAAVLLLMLPVIIPVLSIRMRRKRRA